MNLFHQLEGEVAIVRARGVFKQVDIFERGGQLFVKLGSGFVRLLDNHKTSVPTTFWEELSIKAHVGDLGRLERITE